MPFCRYCGEQAPDDALYCGSCGKTLAASPLEQINISGPLQPVYPTNAQEEQKRQPPAPFVPFPQQPAGKTVPFVQGTPRGGNVPSVLPPIKGMTAKAGMSASAKLLIVAASCAVIIAGSVKIVPIILKGANGNQGSSSVTTTVPMPPTQTSCPPVGTARAAVTAPLLLGQDQNVVYIDDEAQNNGPDIGTIKRYDVKTGTTTEIVKLNNPGSISEAQVSADGRWILFVVYNFQSTDLLSEIQMIRMDGQGLQTLYCASHNTYGNISDIQWSPDQKSVVFDQGSPLYLLDLNSGQLKSQQFQGPDAKSYIPITWLDNTRVYADGFNPSQPLCNYILDIGKSPSRAIQSLQLTGKVCHDGDQGLYGAKQFSNQCNCTQSGSTGPSSITVQSAIDGSTKTIYSSQMLAITNLWVVSSTKLMLRIENSSGDSSQNGLWTINMDGTDLKKVISGSELAQEVDPAGNSIFHVTGELNQYPYWSNSSHNGSLYTIFGWDIANNGPCNMYFGSLNGGSLTRFASFTNCMPDSLDYIDLQENLLEIIGWTTM